MTVRLELSRCKISSRFTWTSAPGSDHTQVLTKQSVFPFTPDCLHFLLPLDGVDRFEHATCVLVVQASAKLFVSSCWLLYAWGGGGGKPLLISKGDAINNFVGVIAAEQDYPGSSRRCGHPECASNIL
jgi:hypothetical protein